MAKERNSVRTDILDEMLDAILIQHLSKDEEDKEIDRLFHLYERSRLELRAGLHLCGMHLVDQVDLEVEYNLSRLFDDDEEGGCDE